MRYGWLWENGSKNDPTIVSCHLKVVSWSIILSTVVCEDHFADPDTFYVFDNNLGVFGEGTRLAMSKTICAPDSSSLKPGSGLLRESWLRGCSDSRTIPSAGLLDYEDTRLKTSSRVRKGLSLAWKASLAIWIFRSPTIVTDSM